MKKIVTFTAQLVAGTYPCRIEFGGDGIHDGCALETTLHVTLPPESPRWIAEWWWLFLIGGILAVATALVMLNRRRHILLTPRQEGQLIRQKLDRVKQDRSIITEGPSAVELLEEKMRQLARRAKRLSNKGQWVAAREVYYKAAAAALKLKKDEIAKIYFQKSKELQDKSEEEPAILED